jgi:S1-C subfamily serine protease
MTIQFRKSILLIAILAIVCGFLAGLISYALATSTGLTIPIIGSLNTENISPDQQIIIERPQTVIVQQSTQLQQIENNTLPVLVDIYQSRTASKPVDRAYLKSEIISGGFVLTADGWVVTTDTAVDVAKNNYTAVGYQGKSYGLRPQVRDSVTGLVFSKIPASNLSVARLGSSATLKVGDVVVIASQRSKLEMAYITQIGSVYRDRQDIIQSSEVPRKEIIIDIPLSKDYEGATVVNLKGEIIGLVRSGAIVALDAVAPIIDQVLAGKTISRPMLGISYIDLSQVEGLADIAEKGALVVGNPLKSSPAVNVLRDGDVITKVNDIELNSHQDLASVINTARPGQKVYFVVRRDNQDIPIEIVLK